MQRLPKEGRAKARAVLRCPEESGFEFPESFPYSGVSGTDVSPQSLGRNARSPNSHLNWSP